MMLSAFLAGTIVARQMASDFKDGDRRAARGSSARDPDFECDPAVAAAIRAFLDHQRTYIEVALRDTDSGDFTRWNGRFGAATGG